MRPTTGSADHRGRSMEVQEMLMQGFRPLLALSGLLVASVTAALPQCDPVQTQLDALEDRAKGACKCYTSGLGKEESGEEPSSTHPEPWVACTRREVPIIHQALQALPNDSSLARLWIWDSLMPIVPADLLDQVRPRQLLIETSSVGKFEEGALDPVGEELRALDLKNNIIRSLHARLFRNLTALRRLDVSGNQVEQLNASAFGSIASLRSLSLQRNGLGSLGDGTFAGLSGLRRLNLAGNRLVALTPAMFTGLDSLEFLSLANNRLEDIAPGTFAALPRLRVLNLAGNKLASLSISALPALETLQLENNSFASLDSVSLSHLPALEILSLDFNKLNSIPPGAFENLPGLASLSLTGNAIDGLETDSFRGLPALSILSLQNNRISALPPAAFPASIAHLFLSGNQLSKIGPSELGNLGELRALSLARNRLASLAPGALASAKRLRRLHLAGNQLQSLDQELLATFEDTIKTIDLSDNPWLCNCTSFWLSEWTRKHIDQIHSPPDTMCVERSGLLVVDAAVALGSECGMGPVEEREGWVTLVGLALGILSFAMLASLVAIWATEAAKQRSLLPSFRRFAMRRTSSDLVGLIAEEGPMLVATAEPPPPLHSHHPTGTGKSVRFTDPSAPNNPVT